MRSWYFLFIGTVLAVLGVWFSEPLKARWGVNPDPINHTHADFAVWIYRQKLDFSDEKYMSGTSDEHDPDHEKHDKYLHLHDGNGHVIHRHKPGLTFGDFLQSLGLTAQDACIRYEDNTLFPAGRFEGKEICASYNYQWRFIVNGKDLSVAGDSDDLQRDVGATLQYAFEYVFVDGDKILLSLADIKNASGEAWSEWKQMTDDACLYSKTCPWRGEPPTENCIADPEVPCTE